MAYSNNSNGNSDLVRLGGLWKNTKDGKTYLSGSFGGAKVMIFPNGFKEKDEDPDYTLCVAPNKPKKDRAESQKSNDFGL